MSIVTGPTLGESAFVQVQDTLQTAYVDLVLDQTLPGGIQNDRPSRALQTGNQFESTSGGCKAIMTGRSQ